MTIEQAGILSGERDKKIDELLLLDVGWAWWESNPESNPISPDLR